MWSKHFICRLVLFGYQDTNKDPRRIIELASETFTPGFAGPYDAAYRAYRVSAVLRDQGGGGQTARGIGVAVVVEKTSPGELDVPRAGRAARG